MGAGRRAAPDAPCAAQQLSSRIRRYTGQCACAAICAGGAAGPGHLQSFCLVAVTNSPHTPSWVFTTCAGFVALLVAHKHHRGACAFSFRHLPFSCKRLMCSCNATHVPAPRAPTSRFAQALAQRFVAARRATPHKELSFPQYFLLLLLCAVGGPHKGVRQGRGPRVGSHELAGTFDRCSAQTDFTLPFTNMIDSFSRERFARANDSLFHNVPSLPAQQLSSSEPV